jgi:hypothetical protein
LDGLEDLPALLEQIPKLEVIRMADLDLETGELVAQHLLKDLPFLGRKFEGLHAWTFDLAGRHPGQRRTFQSGDFRSAEHGARKVPRRNRALREHLYHKRFPDSGNYGAGLPEQGLQGVGDWQDPSARPVWAAAVQTRSGGERLE